MEFAKSSLTWLSFGYCLRHFMTHKYGKVVLANLLVVVNGVLPYILGAGATRI